jgi:hypothetical protein
MIIYNLNFGEKYLLTPRYCHQHSGLYASNVFFSFPDVAGSVWLWIEVANAGIPRVISLHTQVESAKNTTGTVLILSDSVGAGNAVYLYVLL